MTITVQKWGNSLGIRIPKALAHSAGLGQGTQVEVAVVGGRVVLQPVQVPALRELLAKVKPGDQPPLLDWGKPVGKEVW